MTDSKRPSEDGTENKGQGGIRVIRRKIHALTGEGNGSQSLSAPAPAPQIVSDVHLLTFDELARDGAEGHTMYATAVSAEAPVALDVIDAQELGEDAYELVEEPVSTSANTLSGDAAVAKSLRLVTGMDMNLRPATTAEMNDPNFQKFHADVASAAQHLKLLYARTFGTDTMVSPDLTFQVPRHINLTSEGRKLAVQIRIKPFRTRRVQVVFVLKERAAPQSGRRATFMPIDNAPIGFDFPVVATEGVVMVSGDTKQPWFALALNQFLTMVGREPEILLNGKIRQ